MCCIACDPRDELCDQTALKVDLTLGSAVIKTSVYGSSSVQYDWALIEHTYAKVASQPPSGAILLHACEVNLANF